MATFYEALKHKNKLSPTLLRRSDVMGVGVGYADPRKPALGAGIILYTRKNIASSGIYDLNQALAKVTGSGSGVPVRFLPSGGFTSNLATLKKQKPASFQSRIRPVPGGTSIGKVNPFSTGTAGVIVIKNNQLFILSNNHVLIKNNSAAFSETIQPGAADGGRSGIDRVGRAFHFVRLKPSGVNFIDAAIALPLSNRTLNPRYMVSLSGRLITVPGHLLSYRVGARFFKSGRTTGLVSGVVEANNVDVRVNYGGSLGVLLFRNQSIIRGSRPVSLPGDSGSVWLRRSDRFAAALNFAGTQDGIRSISNPLGLVMSTFGLRIAKPAGSGFATGTVKGAAPQGNHAYVQPLSKEQRKRIRAILVKASK